MKLTIGMIVKNEEKYLERCLNGIKPILENVDSELIITDTGSTDRTVEIAEKFTDKILHTDWTKDFSAARNTAFPAASGEWFMFLDADEIFESCDGIIRFFNSGEYKKYKSASFVIRNLYSDNGYVDFYPRRMVKRFPDTRFIGMIHEYLYPILMPSKNIGDTALHYGYLYQTIEESQAKFRRNSEIMLKTLETEKDPHPKIYSQLFDGYGAVFDFAAAFRYLETGIEKCREKHDSYIVILFFQKAEHYYRSADYEKTYAVCEEYFSEKKRMGLPALTTDADIYAYAADSLFALGRCGEAVGFYKKYFAAYKDIKSGKLCTEDMYQKTVEMCSDRALPGLFNNFLGCCINAGKLNTADMYITTFPVAEYISDDKTLVTLCLRMTNVLDGLGYKSAGKYAAKLGEKGRKLFSDMLFVRLYASDYNESISEAIKKTADSTQNKALSSLLACRSGSCEPETLTAAVKKLTEIYAHSLELKKLGGGKAFDISALRCAEDIADIGAGYPAADIPEQIRAARLLGECLEKRKNGQIKECVSDLKNVIKISGAFAPLVSEYSRTLTDETAEKKPMTEMEKLALAVKNNIRAMIAGGKYDNARKTLSDYKQIAPADPETAQIEEMLTKAENK